MFERWFSKEEGFHLRSVYKCPHCKSKFLNPKQVRVVTHASNNVNKATNGKQNKRSLDKLVTRKEGKPGTSPIGNIIHNILYPAKPRKKGRW